MRETLSAYVYTIHKKVQYLYTFIQSTEVKNGIITCKSSNTDEYSNYMISWNEYAQCPCRHSHDLDFQCEHELKHDGCFIAEKFGTRWLQNHVYDKMHSTTTNPDTEYDCFLNNDDVYHNFDASSNTNIEEEDEGDLDGNELQNETVLSHKAMYAMANTKFATTWCLINSNKKLQSTFISALDQLIDRTRNNKSIDIESWVDNIPPDNFGKNVGEPVPDMVLVLPRSRSMTRYKGGCEQQQVV